jgi:hypothetical protein
MKYKPVHILHNYCLDMIDATTNAGNQLANTKEYEKYSNIVLPHIPILFFEFTNKLWTRMEPYINQFMTRIPMD